MLLAGILLVVYGKTYNNVCACVDLSFQGYLV